MKFHNINWIKFINSPVKLKVVKFLSQNKADLSEREIASIVKVSHMSAYFAQLLPPKSENFYHQSRLTFTT